MLNENHIRQLELATLAELDNGNFGRAVRQALAAVIKDIDNRPANIAGKVEARKVNIELKLEPVVEYDEDSGRYKLSGIALEPTCKSILPPVRGGITDVKLRRGVPHFNRDCPRNFHEKPLPLEYDDQPAA